MFPLPVRECFVAHLALHWFLAGVQLLYVQPEVGLPAAGGGAQLTLVHRLLTYKPGDVSRYKYGEGDDAISIDLRDF